MANNKFLEEYPLYRKFITDLKSYHDLSNVPRPSIHMYCKQCQSGQTFNMINKYDELDYYSNNEIPGIVVRLKYQCTGCHNHLRYFLVRFGISEIEVKNDKGEKEKQKVIYMEKVGQYPAWSIEMDKQLEKELGEHAELYKRGLINESQGYGIGAFTYYRRITETIIDQLLDSISTLLEGEEKEKYEVALLEAKKTTVTQEKIDLVKDLLPVSLRPDGMNPLSVLHSALSEGLHAETDNDCLDYAEEIKGVLVYLVNQVERSKSSSKSFTSSMRKILDKRAGKESNDPKPNENN